MGILRFFLALDVILIHCGVNTMGANWAVEGFYIISGFYMTLVLNEKYIEKDSYLRFIKNRFLRLLPTYWFIAILTLIISLSLNVDTNNDLIFSFNKTCSNTSLFSWICAGITNIIAVGQDLALFLGIDSNNGNLFFTVHSFQENFPFCRYMLVPQAWSIGLELFFYLLAPLFLRKKYKYVLPILMISIAIKIIIKKYLLLDDGNWTFRFFPSELMFFTLGYLSYHLYKNKQQKLITKFYKIIPFMVIIFLLSIWFMPIPYFIKYIIFITITTLSTAILFSNFKTNKKDRIIGELSYPMYISHSLIIMIVSVFSISMPYQGIIVPILTIILSYLIYIFLIKKIEVLRK